MLKTLMTVCSFYSLSAVAVNTELTHAASTPTIVQDFFNGKDFTGWKTSTNNGVSEGHEFWRILPDGTLRAEGDPDHNPTTRQQSGLYTVRQDYGNFELSFDYRYTGKERGKNSGVWVLGGARFVSSGGAFPASIEVQLRLGWEGDLLLKQLSLEPEQGYVLSNDARRPNARLAARREGLSINPVQQWTAMKIRVETTAKEGTSVSVWLDGQLVNKGIHAGRDKGRIIFQSEGADIEWRNIQFAQLTTPE
ncbi:3-keto-disaccharide hydrolase [Echinimonas agarilytica]|uniref:DUF1080 domain-containing protein n=1 Tax=Echinimonas agarilytica TaxID=1215918 RepID=A0AA42B7Y1_9GAMM|nr:DUF1080 domain-containing protein [Echinimonas agarilytica]MCM2679736.1 DUF1080 domain-containing protein [Echinimonas agarilytica]